MPPKRWPSSPGPSTTMSCPPGACRGLDPAILRSLDALHLASALSLADELEGIVTYDERLDVAAGLHGVAVVAPSGGVRASETGGLSIVPR